MSGMQTAPYQEFAREKLGFEFENIDYLITALTHRSYVNEHKKSVTEHNERLEFLGDAVLELVVTDYLFRNHSEPEGILTSWRASLVRTESIGEAGDNLGYEPLVRMSRGEKNGSTRARQQILANAFEALIGAMYLDAGYVKCQEFISTHVLSRLDDILENQLFIDPKSRLQEHTQERFSITPSYQVLSEEGPDHAKQFLVGVFLNEKEIARGTGASKQSAQVSAAENALKALAEQPEK